MHLDSWEGDIDEDSTVKLLEDLAATLHSASASEIAMLRETLSEMVADEIASSNRDAVIQYYQNFLYYIGVDEDPPSGAA